MFILLNMKKEITHITWMSLKFAELNKSDISVHTALFHLYKILEH